MMKENEMENEYVYSRVAPAMIMLPMIVIIEFMMYAAAIMKWRKYFYVITVQKRELTKQNKTQKRI